MKLNARFRTLASLIVLACLLLAPVAAFAKGDKNFKRGLQYESQQQWERAAQEFTLAIAAEPSNLEYQLHYRRAVFNASQQLMQQGRALAEQHDYAGAYNAFRQAYGYDPVNQLALSEMERMMRLQGEGDGASVLTGGSSSTRNNTPPAASENGNTATPPLPGTSSSPAQEPVVPPARTEPLRVVQYNNADLKSVIRSLAAELNLNVIFDSQTFRQPRTVDINLRDVTTAQALDFIFIQEGLFFQKLNRRTVLVADQTRRPQYQQLVLRTFYLSNTKPADARNIIQQAIPPQQGRPQTIVIPDEATNSLTVRDTAENIRLIGDLLASIDKERAEVVMDVNIYEVSSSDLMQFGNQLGDIGSTLLNLGGIQQGYSVLGGATRGVTTGSGTGAVNLPTALGTALIFPASTIAALQRRGRTKLIASTQVHAFNGEESSARIGQRVPIQTAQIPYYGTNTTTPGTTPGGTVSGINSYPGYPVIQFEPTGLTLKFTPQVFPNLDVQVKMSIESRDVLEPGTLTPTFIERTISGTARIQNNRTMMLASVAQNRQSNSRQGLPLLGLVPILGRLFTAPRRDNAETDIVIAVTPRVLRAPAVTPHDEELRPSGTLANPTANSLEAMVQEADREDALAAARRIPRNAVVQLPDADTVTYVPAPRALMSNGTTGNAQTAGAPTEAVATNTNQAAAIPVSAAATNTSTMNAPPGTSALASALLASIGDPPGGSPSVRSTAAPVQATNLASAPQSQGNQPANSQNGSSSSAIRQTQAAPASTATSNATANVAVESSPANPVELRMMPERQEMRVGERRRLALVLGTGVPLNSASIKLTFDPRTIAVRGITQGDLAAGARGSAPTVTQSIDPQGQVLVVLAQPDGTSISGAGVLLYIEVEAVAAGESAITIEQDDTRITATDAGSLRLQIAQGRVVVKQQ
ncbi:MAG TPA: secretin N-terminal domain-containing protein [Pyrinomonadaceae bacterium]|nr:secretin N-terminal domain-containing protein [Pyrinomonadaceae bacterium]